MHWAIQYIGKPWVKKAQGPHSFDCWGLMRYVQKHHFNIDVPLIIIDGDDYRAVVKTFKNHPERRNWIKKNSPSDGDCVLMRHSRDDSHVGVWLDVDGGGALHCVQGIGVVFSDLSSLRLNGWSHIEYYRHASRCS
jgi:hypothetical protein